MKISSSDFDHNGLLPQKFTCDEQNISPSLCWSDLPDQTASLILIVDDPDAPGGIFVHWVAYNISPGLTNIAEGIPAVGMTEQGFMQGTNDFNKLGYGGACPPQKHGIHHYHFKLYALDTKLNLPEGAHKDEVMREAEGHILDQCEIVALYER